MEKEIEKLNLIYNQSRCRPWDLEKIGKKIEGFEKAEIEINELGEGIKQLHFKTKEGKIKITFETTWEFSSFLKLPQPRDCIKISKVGKVRPKEIKSIIKKLQKALATQSSFKS
jgi:hypothetical protein